MSYYCQEEDSWWWCFPLLQFTPVVGWQLACLPHTPICLCLLFSVCTCMLLQYRTISGCPSSVGSFLPTLFSSNSWQHQVPRDPESVVTPHTFSASSLTTPFPKKAQGLDGGQHARETLVFFGCLGMSTEGYKSGAERAEGFGPHCGVATAQHDSTGGLHFLWNNFSKIWCLTHRFSRWKFTVDER